MAAGIQWISPQELSDLKSNQVSYLLIDCRHFLEFSTRHLYGAVNIAASRALRRQLNGSQQGELIQQLVCQLQSYSSSTSPSTSSTSLHIILYDSVTGFESNDENPPCTLLESSECFVALLYRRFTQHVAQPVFLLNGGFLSCAHACPHLSCDCQERGGDGGGVCTRTAIIPSSLPTLAPTSFPCCQHAQPLKQNTTPHWISNGSPTSQEASPFPSASSNEQPWLSRLLPSPTSAPQQALSRISPLTGRSITIMGISELFKTSTPSTSSSSNSLVSTPSPSAASPAQPSAAATGMAAVASFFKPIFSLLPSPTLRRPCVPPPFPKVESESPGNPRTNEPLSSSEPPLTPVPNTQRNPPTTPRQRHMPPPLTIESAVNPNARDTAPPLTPFLSPFPAAPTTSLSSGLLTKSCSAQLESVSGSSTGGGSHHPVTRVLPHLFLGCQEDALRATTLREHSITHCINVSRSGEACPFLACKPGRFLRIPIDDGYVEDIGSHLEVAFQFLDEVKCQNGRCLIHCYAGISRSPTFAIAYIMKTTGKTMMEAHDYVRSLRPCIAPNFNFLGQLLELERQWLVPPTPPAAVPNSSNNTFVVPKIISTGISPPSAQSPILGPPACRQQEISATSGSSGGNTLSRPDRLGVMKRSNSELPSPSQHFKKLALHSPISPNSPISDEAAVLQSDSGGSMSPLSSLFPTTSLSQVTFRPCAAWKPAESPTGMVARMSKQQRRSHMLRPLPIISLSSATGKLPSPSTSSTSFSSLNRETDTHAGSDARMAMMMRPNTLQIRVSSALPCQAQQTTSATGAIGNSTSNCAISAHQLSSSDSVSSSTSSTTNEGPLPCA